MIVIIGYILQLISGLLLLGAMIGMLVDWLGFLGYLVWPFFSPGIIVFPLIYWFVEGFLPINYILIWALGLVGTGITMLGATESEI